MRDPSCRVMLVEGASRTLRLPDCVVSHRPLICGCFAPGMRPPPGATVGGAMTRLARLPGRLRLALALAGLVAILLGATGVFVYLQLGAQLDDTIDQGLRTRANDLTALVQRGAPLPADDEDN